MCCNMKQLLSGPGWHNAELLASARFAGVHENPFCLIWSRLRWAGVILVGGSTCTLHARHQYPSSAVRLCSDFRWSPLHQGGVVGSSTRVGRSIFGGATQPSCPWVAVLSPVPLRPHASNRPSRCQTKMASWPSQVGCWTAKSATPTIPGTAAGSWELFSDPCPVMVPGHVLQQWSEPSSSDAQSTLRGLPRRRRTLLKEVHRGVSLLSQQATLPPCTPHAS